MLTQAEKQYFVQEQARHEAGYLAGATPQEQSGFQRDAQAWKRYRRPLVDPIHKAGTFLDIGCANGLLMEDVATWTREDGHGVEVYGLDISEALVELAKRQFPHLSRRVFVGNALLWDPPMRFDFVRTELVYVPAPLRRRYVERLLSRFVASDGKLIICSYGSSRPEGSRAALLVDEIESWGFVVSDIHDARSREHGLVVTRVVALEAGKQPKQAKQAADPEDGRATATFEKNFNRMVVTKAVACVLRATPSACTLLVFEHPDGTMQLPKGTVESDEPVDKAVIRELKEESGLADVRLHSKLARLERRLPSGPISDGPLEDQVWHVFSLEPNSDLPDSWQHVVTDGPTEAGLTFSFRWIPLAQAPALLDALFMPVADALLRASIQKGGNIPNHG